MQAFPHLFFVLVLLSSFVGGSAMAAEANRYECSGEFQVATLHKSIDTGSASLKITNLGLGGESAEVSLDQVTIRQDLMGLMANGFYLGITDARLSFTLIVPAVVISDDYPLHGVEGILIRSFAALTPPPDNTHVSGARQHLQFFPLTCTASLLRNLN